MACSLSDQLCMDLDTLKTHIRTAVILQSQTDPSLDTIAKLGQALSDFGRHLTETGDRVASLARARSLALRSGVPGSWTTPDASLGLLDGVG